jgi:hypothetical protein
MTTARAARHGPLDRGNRVGGVTRLGSPRAGCATSGGLDRIGEVDVDGRVPDPGHPSEPAPAGGTEMTAATSPTRTIEVTEEVYDVLARTAASRDTDINGALRYLTEAPPVPATPADNDED